MAVALIFVSLVATFIGLTVSNYQTNGFRRAFLKTSILHGLIIAVTTEFLSLGKSLTFASLVFVWAAIAAINSGCAIFLIYRNRSYLSSYSICQQIKSSFKNQNLANKVAVIAIIIILSICLVTALIAPPNNYDSLTYHIPRVMYWIQHQSVAHYPTHNLRQIAFPPGAGYIITHLQILAGSDRFANCLQWWGFLGSIIGTSLIAKNVAGIHTQAITALVCASIPMAIMQSTTPQTDLIVSFWLVCFAYFIFQNDNYSPKDIFWLSTSLGLAILTKPTAVIFGIPLLVVFGIRTLINRFKNINRLSKALVGSAIATLTIFILSLILSLPFYYRNFQVFGNIIGTDTGTINTIFGLSQFTSNLLRNLALNVPFTFFWQWVEAIHNNILNLDTNALETTFFGGRVFFSKSAWTMVIPDEDVVGSPIHLGLLLLAILTLLAVIILRKNQKLFSLLELTIGNLTGFILFCLLLKWQPWANRLLLPYFILSAPVVGYFINSCLSISMQRVLSVVLAFVAIIYSLIPMRHPLVSYRIFYQNQIYIRSESILSLKREEIYFFAASDSYQSLNNILNLMIEKQCSSLGLDTGSNDPEYLLWVLVKSKGLEKKFTIHHVNVKNESRKKESDSYNPDVCLVITK
ncbi:glycosyltransferase family 39 protein [Okeania sp. SIO1I7]|uniref:ArnT family glycosyltransferase n=1 Tax=Okeania sp. SIO1I7 TaxID=2607772 RepID=UPI0013FB5240|nr:glycosyltransferase family 39 protein [Okeania sp. SIO1I7]NET28209.1 hypothetical protein [Okeania sp. SIO1I7]